MDDLLIRGGHVIDGTGAPGRDADVSIAAGRIVAIESRSSRPAYRAIDARGQVVAPGLIDIHPHSDFTLPLNPRAESKIRQGVTTEVVGNCGFSVAPALPGRVEMLREYLASSAPWLPFRESTFADYVAAFPPTSINVILQVGHHTLRLMAAGMEERPLTDAERAVMTRLLEEIETARRRGVPVDVDAYPYDTATNPLRNLLPRWIMDGGIPAMLERLGRRDIRTRLRDDITRNGLTNFGRIPSWDVVRVA